MGILILVVGFILMFVGLIMIVIPAFKEHILWGLGSLFIFIPVGLIFAFMHWKDTKKGFIFWVIGFVIYIIGLVSSAAEIADGMNQLNENMQDSQ